MELNYGFILEKTGRKIKQTLQKRFVALGYDITVDQWVILNELYLQGTQNQVDLCERVFKDAPTITRMIELLVRKELVQREPCKDDRRKFRISLSKNGRALVEKLMPEVVTFRKQGWTGLNQTDIAQLKRITQKIFDNLEYAE
jgi:DNA-binding MarR family transcriptional regulator